MQHEWENVERGLYRDRNTGQYYERIRGSGRNTWQCLYTSKISEARQRLDAQRAARAAAKMGLEVEDPDAERVTVTAVIKRYQEDGYPDRNGIARDRIGMEKDYCATLLSFFRDGQLADDLSPKVLDQYHQWRLQNVIRGTGHRATDLELNTLNNALRWAVRKELIETNPIASRSRYHSSRKARHCRELAPSDADELHGIA